MVALLLYGTSCWLVRGQEVLYYYWSPVPVPEAEFVNGNDTVYEGESKTEMACSIEATRALANLFCFEADLCRYSNLTKVQLRDDYLKMNSSLFCRTRLQGCLHNGNLFEYDEIYEVEEECLICVKLEGMKDLLSDTPIPTTGIGTLSK